MNKLFLFSLLFFCSVCVSAQEWGVTPSRTENRQNAGLQGGQGAKSGFFEALNPTNYPSNSGWWHLLDVRHGNGDNNYAMQFAGGFYDQGLFFRKTNNNPATAWSKVMLLDNNNTLTTGGFQLPSEYNHISFPESLGFKGGITADDGNYKRLTFYHGNSIAFETGSNTVNYGNTRLFIAQNGNVGIKTGNPAGVLDVNFTNTEPKSFTVFSSTSNDVSNPVGGLRLGWYYTNYAEVQMVRGNNSNDGVGLSFHTSTSNNGSTGERMRITQNGNVGIGTTSPDAKLAVKGTVHASEVRVDNSVPAPDYVFKKDYDLRSLSEVEDYIKANSHLPEVPSAKEIEKNGIKLSEMSMLLLKKVEELTLYLLEKDKMLNEQKERLDRLENQLNNLKK